MKKWLFVLGCLSLLFAGAEAQQAGYILNKLQSATAKSGKVQISQSESIKKVLDLHLQAKRKEVKNNGWRICVFADSGQEANRKAEGVRSVFISRFQKVQPYKIFNYPFYRVYVGDFRTKSEALKFLKMLEAEFPNAYIVPDVIAPLGLN
ncbi:MAG: SPOR domain-containing protein [Bacteroidales bacterium]|nr:SPOR domain-containing protein [Bacteroidales bacterium]